ncbi:Homogentisate 1,2-dioxygenase [Fusarium sp. MPI-SDFR-AT-0072]|nr:Homogentisate 1,2-dioxygenase [Fusarium sp. MPI-SDFR-AT-0072]
MPVTKFSTPEKYSYLNGFDSFHESESIKGALPIGANSPQKPPYGLYAEKLSGTAFTAPRHENRQTWLYRILPSASHSTYKRFTDPSSPILKAKLNYEPQQLRWDPFDIDEKVDWVRGLKLVSGAGDPTVKSGLGIYVFAAGRDMDTNTAMYSSDGEMLIVVQHGVLDIQTELGRLLVRPNEIAIIPRGVRYRITLPEGPVRGYILELYQGQFQLPELGPIGSNCLANPRDFQIPVADFDEDTKSTWTILNKFNNELFVAEQGHTPFDVVAWHGKFYPYKYDLGRFSVIGSISFDHPDPSIFTVLTGPSDHPGTAIADFVIFPPRWLVQEDTFRPPWYHRNTMSEFMGLICGQYDAKTGGGFQPAGASLHNIMSAHGPDADSYERASNAELKPVKVGEGSMAFMFESSLMLGITDWGLETCKKVQPDYNKHSWEELKVHFKRPS